MKENSVKLNIYALENSVGDKQQHPESQKKKVLLFIWILALYLN